MLRAMLGVTRRERPRKRRHPPIPSGEKHNLRSGKAKIAEIAMSQEAKTASQKLVEKIVQVRDREAGAKHVTLEWFRIAHS